MKILHTADWHLGKKLNTYNRIYEQYKVLNEIVAIAENEAVDLVLIAGDLFDNFTPSNEATELLYKTLKKLSRNGKVPVIAIAGNHDSPDRINIPDVLARENGIILIGNPTDILPLFELENSFSIIQSESGFIEIQLPHFDFPVRILHTAFANEVRLKEFFSEDKLSSLQESLQNKWKMLSDKYCDNQGVNLLITHLYMMKRGEKMEEEPEGERPINIGNADVVFSDAIPSEIQYAALGHLHRFQNVGIHQPAIYSGSPLSYSFAEAGQVKYVSLIEIAPQQEASITKIELKKGKLLKKVTFAAVDEAVKWLSENQNTLVELTLEIDEFLTAEERRKLEQSHSGIIHIIPKVKQDAMLTTKNIAPVDLGDIQKMFKSYFKAKNSGQEPNQEIVDLFNEILNA